MATFNADSLTVSSVSFSTGIDIVASAHALAAVSSLPDAYKASAVVAKTVVYHMRGYSSGLGRQVYWDAPVIDSSASYYGGGGTPLTDIVMTGLKTT